MLFTDISSKQAVRAFQKIGYKIIRQRKHIAMSDGQHLILIPRHSRLNPYTLKSIIRYSGLTDEQFKNLL
jgi:predicted RNA binding protein YcfA (HicA-like mRNA interferase family)